jgi:hypothetical protein
LQEPNSHDDDKAKLTGVGCVVILLTVAVIVVTAVPLVMWRDPVNGEPLSRKAAIPAPFAVAAVFFGVVSFVLKLVGLPVWSMPPKEEHNGEAR